ncbi:hypothetical protein SAMN05421788_103118 [Filimonas lacunae]|uniref:Uncharacterized protein n=1 Tax=Filimonas lacunae TaxID=477680 RepID=A0A1N7P1T6_9BACT|nr:hypothetical protein SAMN05421788_103118 [Filimonas lacunae]
MLLLVVFVSCGARKNTSSCYYFIEPFKEQEVKFQLINDSCFSISDETGCYRFLYEGRYKLQKQKRSSYLLLDTVIKSEMPSWQYPPERVFPMNDKDTVRIVSKKRILISKQVFRPTDNPLLDLQKIRVDMLVDYFVRKLGKAAVVQVMGDGKSIELVRKRLMECFLSDLNVEL